jgi:hypothetical protein
MICGYCEIENDADHGYCAGCGSPLRDGGLPHPTYADAVAKGRTEERAAIVKRIRREAKSVRRDGLGTGVYQGGEAFSDVAATCIEHLAIGIEDGRHLRGKRNR